MPIEVHADEWFMTAGLIGFVRLLGQDQVTMTKHGIELNSKDIQNLSTRYIHKLIEEFSVVRRDVKRMNWYLEQMKKKPENTKAYVAEIRKQISEQFKKVDKYFSDSEECGLMSQILDQLKEVGSSEDQEKVRRAVQDYEQLASTPMINEKLTLNYAKAIILNPFYGQTSILQPVFNSKSIEEHIQQIEKDFVRPAYLELLLYERINTSPDQHPIIQFLTDHQEEYKPFKDWLKKLKKCTSIDEIRLYFQEELLPCSFLDELTATQSYEEMVFSPLALSKSKAVNFHWEFDHKLPVPMSAVARLIMFLVPFGVTFYTRKRGTPTSSENIRFAGIVISQQSFKSILKENNYYKHLRGQDLSFGEAIVGLFQESKDKAERIQHAYQFVEVYSDYQMKKTLLDYYHMPPYLVHYFSKYGNALTLLLHYDFRDSFIRSILQGVDPKQTLFQYLREAVKNEFHGAGAYHASRERRRIIDAREDVNQMGSYDKQIGFIYYCGVELRESMVKKRPGLEEEGPYRASGRKKLEGIAYRLINAVKAGNKKEFMDTIFRLYMSANQEVPRIFIDIFKEEGLDFETIASSFIAGMLGNEKSKKEEEAAHG
ncbi:hypothetical protein [Marinicrinis sediminis]|uniref:Type I-B CRISPR-associated protein Cas8b1/Cst1 n=1 Tax=Marinicrinis sediminis TaxID=1652465 RepID=A0ABW5R663_9BACL